MTTLGQIVAAGAVVALFALPSPTETLAPNFFTAGGKDLPSVGRRSSESTVGTKWILFLSYMLDSVQNISLVT